MYPTKYQQYNNNVGEEYKQCIQSKNCISKVRLNLWCCMSPEATTNISTKQHKYNPLMPGVL